MRGRPLLPTALLPRCNVRQTSGTPRLFSYSLLLRAAMTRRKDAMAEHGVWYYAAAGHEEEALPKLRAETWRAMEDALLQGHTRAIGGVRLIPPLLNMPHHTATKSHLTTTHHTLTTSPHPPHLTLPHITTLHTTHLDALNHNASPHLAAPHLRNSHHLTSLPCISTHCLTPPHLNSSPHIASHHLTPPRLSTPSHRTSTQYHTPHMSLKSLVPA